jgi:predicted transcriptional regulator
MSTAELKSSLHQLIEDVQDSKILKAIYTLLSKKETLEVDFWDELSDAQKASVERGITQADKGEFKSHKEVMKKYQKWA